MSKPTPGKIYTIQQGDTLEKISGQAYGDPLQYDRITEVNQLQVNVLSTDQLPTGETLIIPENPDLANLRTSQLKNGLENVTR